MEMFNKNNQALVNDDNFEEFDNELSHTTSHDLVEGKGSKDLDDFQEDDDISFDDSSFGEVTGSAPLEKHQELLKTLTNFDPYLQQKMLEWSGLRWNTQKREFEPDGFTRPVMNLKGAKWCASFLKTYVRGNNIITNIDEDSYKRKMNNIIDVLMSMLADNYIEFEINSVADQRRIMAEIVDSASLILEGADSGKYNDFLSKVTHVTENIQSKSDAINESQTSQGFFGKVKNVIGIGGGN